MILTYHNIGERDDENYITKKIFLDQITLIKELKLKPVTLEEYDKHNPNHVVITFDDGKKNILSIINFLKNNNFPFYVFLIGDMIGSSEEYLSESDFKKIISAGGYLGWHTKSHSDLTKLSEEKIKNELKNPYGITKLSYPYWQNNELVRELCKECGYLYCRSGNGHADGNGDNYSLDSIKVKKDTDLKLYSNVRLHKFIECIIPIKACNMRCAYCYVTQNHWWDSKKINLSYCISKIDKAFSLERMGGHCLINLCSTGETLLYEETVEIIYHFLKIGHYVMVVTNGSLRKRILKLCSLPLEYRKRLFLKISLHYLELIRLKKLELFFENIKLCKNSGISYTVELTPDDSYIPYINDIKKVCIENLGALCHITVPRDETKPGFPLMTAHSREDFVKIWRNFNSDLFDFKESIFEVKRNEFCYAGSWSFVTDIVTGDYRQCYRGKTLGNLYTDLSSPLIEEPVGHNCPEGHCYNGHVFLGLGLIPNFYAPTYEKMRNRIELDGSEWVSKEIKFIMSQKLKLDNTVS